MQDADIERTYATPETEGVHRANFPDHWERYEFVSQFVSGKDVVDVACGCGYGTALLAKTARNAVGMDIDEPTVRWAQQHYGDKAKFQHLSEPDWPLKSSSADVVVTLETFEHVPAPSKFLSEAVRVLRPGGIIILSTPCNELESRFSPSNPFHLREYSWAELGEVLTVAGVSVEKRWSQVSHLSESWTAVKNARFGGVITGIKSLLPIALVERLKKSAANLPGMKGGSIMDGYVSGASVQIALARVRDAENQRG